MNLFDDDDFKPLELPFGAAHAAEQKRKNQERLEFLKSFKRADDIRRLRLEYDIFRAILLVSMWCATILFVVLIAVITFASVVAMLGKDGTRVLEGAVALPALSFGLAFSAFPRTFATDWNLRTRFALHASGLAMMLGAMLAILAYGLSWSVEHSPVMLALPEAPRAILWVYALLCITVGGLIWISGFSGFLFLLSVSFTDVLLHKHPGHPQHWPKKTDNGPKDHQKP